jgi:hypothetical protein
MNKIRAFYGLLSLLSLALGMIIFLLFRDLNNMVLFSWIPKPEFLKTTLMPLKPTIVSGFLRYNLPDMLWLVSAVLLFRFIWFYKIKIQRAYIFSFYIAAIAFETSQLIKNIPGTFDLLDLFFMGIAAFVESLLYNNIIKRGLT